MLKNLLILAGFSTFAVAVIVGLNIYHGQVTSTIEPINQKGITPINPIFDTETIEQLQKRQSISVDLSRNSEIITQDTVTADPDEEEEQEETQTSTQSAILSAPTPTQTLTPLDTEE